MALHVYECSQGHKVEILEEIWRDNSGLLCDTQLHNGCTRRLLLSAAVATAPPKFVKGSGGFYAPTTPE